MQAMDSMCVGLGGNPITMGIHRGGQEGTVHISFHLFMHWPQLTVVSVAIPRRFFFCAAEFSFSSFPSCSLPPPLSLCCRIVLLQL
ncbi:hypothetical protein XELAEV_18002772mg [Xenopus laevis]|uniref:Uncharacterized protein n=1 Tax=Xenopus laevis TaxID=8355 RepID=A0A974BP27_XENLA|nr:hypothetical protein XELAEV_18002772mg [Xenopus laevis]